MAKPKVRKFTHSIFFVDDTDHIEAVGSKVFIVTKHGVRQEITALTLGQCLDYVKHGQWVEIQDQP